MSRLTQKKRKQQKANQSIKETLPTHQTSTPLEEETAAILAQIEAERDYYHTCINGSY